MNLLCSKLLAVDDSVLLHHVYDLVFSDHRRRGMQLLHAPNGKAALEILDRNPDTECILLDLVMPVMDGPAMLALLRKSPHRDIPVIIVSSKGHERDISAALAGGASAYLTKPVDAVKLKRLIRALVARRKAPPRP